jgi:hypothetical protein
MKEKGMKSAGKCGLQSGSYLGGGHNRCGGMLRRRRRRRRHWRVCLNGRRCQWKRAGSGHGNTGQLVELGFEKAVGGGFRSRRCRW